MLALFNPILAGAAMALSSVFVVTNIYRRPRFHLLLAPVSSHPTTTRSDVPAAARV